jgi:hypothetical protein
MSDTPQCLISTNKPGEQQLQPILCCDKVKYQPRGNPTGRTDRWELDDYMSKLVKFSGQLLLPDYETNPPIIQTTSGGTYAPGLIEVIKKSERSPLSLFPGITGLGVG